MEFAFFSNASSVSEEKFRADLVLLAFGLLQVHMTSRSDELLSLVDMP